MKTVLLADDSTLTREIVSPIIENSGYQVITAEDGKQAVTTCFEKQPDMVIMDLYLPNIDGFVATKILRDKGFTCPIIALSSSELDDDREKAIKAGFDEFILKTLEMKDVEHTVDKYLYEAAEIFA